MRVGEWEIMEGGGRRKWAVEVTILFNIPSFVHGFFSDFIYEVNKRHDEIKFLFFRILYIYTKECLCAST